MNTNETERNTSISDPSSWHNRLNIISWEIVQLSSQMDYEGWYRGLIGLWKELIGLISRSKREKKITKLRTELAKEYREFLTTTQSHSSLTKKDQKNFPFMINESFIQKLEQFEIELRFVIDDNKIWGDTTDTNEQYQQ